MNFKATVLGLGLLCGAVAASTASAQVVVVGGVPAYSSTVVVARPVVPAVAVLPAPVVAPTYVTPTYAAGFSTGYVPSYSSYSSSYGVYSTYRPVVPTTYIAPAPVVRYSPVVPVYAPVRTGVASTRVYYPGQPVRNALRVIAP